MTLRHGLGFSVVFILMAAWLAGCNPSKPNLRVDPKTGEIIRVEEPSLPEVKVVSGESLTPLEEEEEIGQTGEDKTGAVAVKMQY